MKNFEELFLGIKSEYCNLFQYKVHGNGRTLEIITPNSTMSDKFVSVFLTIRNDKFVVTDGGWLDKNTYESDYFKEDQEITELLISQLIKYFEIDVKDLPDKLRVFYKTTEEISKIPSLVFDMANLISNVVNVNSFEFRAKKEKEERDKFKSKTNDFLKDYYGDQFESRFEVEGIRFSGVIRQKNRIHVLEYVTGSSVYYFENDLRKAAVNFQIIKDSALSDYVGERIAILNNKSYGFKNNPSLVLQEFLKKSLSQDFITWSHREKVKDLIPLN